MAIANIFQKLGTVQTAAIAGVLSLSSLLSFNAQAQEPKATTVSNAVPAKIAPDVQNRIDQANQRIDDAIRKTEELAERSRQTAKGPTLVQVNKYSTENVGIGVLLFIGPKNPEDATAGAADIEKYFKDKGIEIQIIPDKSPREFSAVSYSVNGKPSKAHILKPAGTEATPAGAELAYEEFKRIHGVTAGMLKSPAMADSAMITTPSISHQ